jgi:hypothetical protein
MPFLVVVLIIVFLLGLMFRNKGDNFLDTLSSGCSSLFWIIIIIVVILILMYK